MSGPGRLPGSNGQTGGVVLERAAIEAKINELVGRYIASRNQA